MRHVRFVRFVLAMVGGTCAAGCGGGTVLLDEADPTSAVRRGPPAVGEAPAAWPAEVTVAMDGGPSVATEADSADQNYVSLVSTFELPGSTDSERVIPVRSSALTVRFDEANVSLMGMAVDLPDVVVGAEEFPPDGLVLTAVALRGADVIDAPFVVVSDTVRTVDVAFEVTLTWGLIDAAGEVYYLAPVTMPAVPATLVITRDLATGHVAVDFAAGIAGDPIANSLIVIHEATVSVLLEGDAAAD